jgi:hypothetical protein
MVGLRWPVMATAPASFGVVLAALVLLAPMVSAGPTATWEGTTPTFLCLDWSCKIVSPPVDDSYVRVGTGSAREVRLTLESNTGQPLALRYEQPGGTITTGSRVFQQTGWLQAPGDRVLEVAVLDPAFPSSGTGIRPAAHFTLVAEYR